MTGLALWTLNIRNGLALWTLNNRTGLSLWTLTNWTGLSLWTLNIRTGMALWTLNNMTGLALWTLNIRTGLALWTLNNRTGLSLWTLNVPETVNFRNDSFMRPLSTCPTRGLISGNFTVFMFLPADNRVYKSQIRILHPRRYGPWCPLHCPRVGARSGHLASCRTYWPIQILS